MGLPYHKHNFEVPEATQAEVDAYLQVSAFVTPDKLAGFVTTATLTAGYQPLDADLTAIAALSPSNDDVLQRKAGSWTNRTIAQLLTDLGIAAAYQPLDTDLTAIAALTSAADKVPYATGAGTWALADFTVAGRNLVDHASADAQRPTLGLTANGKSLVTAADYAAMRALLDLEVGTDFLSPAAIAAAYQPLDGDLTAIAALTSAADKGIQFTGAGTAATYDLTAAGKALLDDADASAQRTTLGLVIGTNVQAYSSVLANTTASFTTADETKLDGIEALADVTDATNVAAAGAVMESDTSTASMSFVIDEDSMASDSATKVPTQQSVKAYVDAAVGSGGGWTVLSGPTSLSGSSTGFTSISASYADLMIVCSGLSGTSSADLRIEISVDNGSTYSTARVIASALSNGGTYTAAILITGYLQNIGSIIGSVTSSAPSSPHVSGPAGSLNATFLGTGGIDAARVSLSAGTFDAGTVTLLAR